MKNQNNEKKNDDKKSFYFLNIIQQNILGFNIKYS